MVPVLTEHNIVLVNSLRNVALKSSADFNAVKFFADFNYAKDCLSRFEHSGIPELSALARKAADALFGPPAPRPAVAPPQHQLQAEAPLLNHPEEAAAPLGAPAKPLSDFQRFMAAKELVNSLVVDAVGLRSFFFVLQLERCNTGADLAALMPKFQQLLAKGMGAFAADAVVAQVKRMF